MFQRLTLTLITSFLFLSFAHGDEGSAAGTQKACSQANTQICASVEFQEAPSVQKDSAFVLTLSGIAATAVKDLRVDLWMEMGSHGHGSAPVEIADLGNNRYQVKNVWFVMEGPWRVRIWLQEGSRQHQIQIPVSVQ